MSSFWKYLASKKHNGRGKWPPPKEAARQKLVATLVRARRKKLWSERDLARYSGIDRVDIQRIISGERLHPRLSTIKALFTALGIDSVEAEALYREMSGIPFGIEIPDDCLPRFDYGDTK